MLGGVATAVGRGRRISESDSPWPAGPFSSRCADDCDSWLRPRTDLVGGRHVGRGASGFSRRCLPADEGSPRRDRGRPGRSRAWAGLSRRGGDLGRGLGGAALRPLGGECPGVGTRGPSGLEHPAPGGFVVRGGDLFGQAARGGRGGDARDRPRVGDQAKECSVADLAEMARTEGQGRCRGG